MTNMVNMQVMVQKVTDVARIQHEHQQMNVSRQAEFAQQIQDQTSKMATKVAEPNQNEKPHIQDKPEREKSKKEKQKNRTKNAHTKEQEEGSAVINRTILKRIDITI